MLDLVKNNSIIISILISTLSCLGYYLYNRNLQDDKKASKTIYIKVFLSILTSTYGLIYLLQNNVLSKSSEGSKITNLIPKFTNNDSNNTSQETKNKLTPNLLENSQMKKSLNDSVNINEKSLEKNNVTQNKTTRDDNSTTMVDKSNVDKSSINNLNNLNNSSPTQQLSIINNQPSTVEKFLTGNPNF